MKVSKDSSSDSDKRRKRRIMKDGEWEKIGAVGFDGEAQRWNLDGVFTDVEEHGSFDWAYKHPRILEGGSYYIFKMDRSSKYANRDARFMLKISYFTGWNQARGDGCVDIGFNSFELCHSKSVKGEHEGR